MSFFSFFFLSGLFVVVVVVKGALANFFSPRPFVRLSRAQAIKLSDPHHHSPFLFDHAKSLTRITAN